MILYLCPDCNEGFQCDDKYAGDTVMCPKCKLRFLIPLKSQDGVKEEETTQLYPGMKPTKNKGSKIILKAEGAQHVRRPMGHNRSNAYSSMIVGAIVILLLGALVITLFVLSGQKPTPILDTPTVSPIETQSADATLNAPLGKEPARKYLPVEPYRDIPLGDYYDHAKQLYAQLLRGAKADSVDTTSIDSQIMIYRKQFTPLWVADGNQVISAVMKTSNVSLILTTCSHFPPNEAVLDPVSENMIHWLMKANPMDPADMKIGVYQNEKLAMRLKKLLPTYYVDNISGSIRDCEHYDALLFFDCELRESDLVEVRRLIEQGLGVMMHTTTLQTFEGLAFVKKLGLRIDPVSPALNSLTLPVRGKPSASKALTETKRTQKK